MDGTQGLQGSHLNTRLEHQKSSARPFLDHGRKGSRVGLRQRRCGKPAYPQVEPWHSCALRHVISAGSGFAIRLRTGASARTYDGGCGSGACATSQHAFRPVARLKMVPEASHDLRVPGQTQLLLAGNSQMERCMALRRLK